MTAHIDPDIQAEEDRLTQATRTLDVAALDRLYADDIMFTGVTGVICTKANLMDEARRGVAERQAAAGKPAAVSYEKDDLHGIRHGDTAVTSYRFVVTMKHEGQDIVRRYRTTNVWARQNAAWQVIAAHTAAI